MPKGVYPRLPIEERFWSKVEKTPTCWLWLEGKDKDGYGLFYIQGETTRAHHFLAGKPPEGFVWDHSVALGCLNRHCVRPSHLEAVTTRINNLRGTGQPARNARKTVCAQGHPLSGPNLYVVMATGARQCRECRRRRTREYRAKP